MRILVPIMDYFLRVNLYWIISQGEFLEVTSLDYGIWIFLRFLMQSVGSPSRNRLFLYREYES